MTTDILIFLNKHCPDVLRLVLKECEFELLEGERLSVKGKEVSFSELGDNTLKKIYDRLLRAKNKSGFNPAPENNKREYDDLLNAVQNDYNKQKQEREVSIIRSELYMSIQNASVISDSLAGNIIARIDCINKEMQNVISRKVKPDESLSYENYKKLNELFDKGLSLNGLEFYSAESEEALRLWQKQLTELSESGGIKICSLTPSAILFLHKQGYITSSDVVQYFLKKKEYVSWGTIRELVAILLADTSQFQNLYQLIKRCDDGLTSLLEEFNVDRVSQFAVFLKKEGVTLSGLPTKTVNDLYALGVVDIDSVLSFYLRKRGYTWEQYRQPPFRWEEIKDIIHSLLSIPSHFEDLSTLLKRCGGLEKLFEEFEADELREFVSFLLEKGIDITQQTPMVVNSLFDLGVVPQSSVIQYYLHITPTDSRYWGYINNLVSVLLDDESQYNNLTALIKRDSHGLSHLFETFEVSSLLPFIKYLRGEGMSFIDICCKIPRQKREELLRKKIEAGTPFEHETIIQNYFDKCGNDVSLDLYAFLFSRNCYFRCILSAFRRDLNHVDQARIINLRACATQTKAWKIANEIILATQKEN